jgi:hypothetical protein
MSSSSSDFTDSENGPKTRSSTPVSDDSVIKPVTKDLKMDVVDGSLSDSQRDSRCFRRVLQIMNAQVHSKIFWGMLFTGLLSGFFNGLFGARMEYFVCHFSALMFTYSN